VSKVTHLVVVVVNLTTLSVIQVSTGCTFILSLITAAYLIGTLYVPAFPVTITILR
jgi:hypothetical protein